MVPLNFLLIPICFLLMSCAKVSYLWDQGIGQVRLLSRGKPNQLLLKSDKTPQEVKDKLVKIESYKKYFYEYWSMKPTGIYTETTLLDQDAVTYLVIASKFNEIKAKQECFPFMGCFPYLGFFSQEKALSYAKDLQAKEYETYVRPVYAYSTLGYFEDNILSSFFHYQDFELTELIFHELFHTLFFIENEVDLNEALATYFAREMALSFFAYTEHQIEGKNALEGKYASLNAAFVLVINELKSLYEKNKPKTSQEATNLRSKFIESTLQPKMKRVCSELKLENCYPLKGDWNNARLAAFLTYQDKGDDLLKLHHSLGLDLKGFFQHIKRSYEKYQEDDVEGSFTNFLMKTSSSK